MRTETNLNMWLLMCCLCIAIGANANATSAEEPVLVGGRIIGWGEMAVNSGELDCKDFVAIATDYFHCLALKQDGSIVGWGRDDYGQAIPPAGNDYVAIAAGREHSLALRQDGSIIGWGRDNYDQATPPAGNDFIAIAAGSYHSLALKQDGSIVGWGRDNYDQTTPPGGNDYVAIAAGREHCLALKKDGSIVGWGWDKYGQATPPEGNDFIAIAAGSYHSLALKQDGSIVAWGENLRGQATPPEDNDYIAIAAGGIFSLALKQDGSIVGWGNNYEGQATPPAGSDYVAIAAGGYHSLAIKQDGSIVGWGNNDYGETVLPAVSGYVTIAAAGGRQCLALKQDGSIVGWGWDKYGQATPPAGNAFVAIAAGEWHSLALKQDGSIVGWGRDNYDQATPPTGNDYVAIAAGYKHCLALKQDGSIVGWGDNDYGQATPPAGNDYVAITSGYYHSLALKQDGSIVGWGYNYDGQATPPAGKDFAAIAAGESHCLALKQDGSIVGWGNDNYGQATPPAGNDYVAIAAGGWHCLALKQDGSIIGWGRNDYGQATPPAGNDYVAIVAGGYHSLAIETEFIYISTDTGDDNNDGLNPDTAFATIQKGINEAKDGDTILVYPGLYTEEVDFLGKAITVRSAGDAAVLETQDYFAVLFCSGEGPSSVLKNFVIRNSLLAALIEGSSPTISNVTVVDNVFGIAAYGQAQPEINNSIFWNNIHGDLFGCQARYSSTAEAGEGNLAADPRFADPDNGDYRLLSERGRYWPAHDIWVLDKVTSPCIDGGDPAVNYSGEPMPNGGRINMGAYGGTAYASMKELRWSAGDISRDGWIDMTDFVMLAKHWLQYEPPTSNFPPMVNILTPHDGTMFDLYFPDVAIPIEANAWDPDGLVRIVEFFADGAGIGGDDDGSDGWKTVWEEPPWGTHTIDAKATDDDGAMKASAPIEIEIRDGIKGRACFPAGTGVWVDGELVHISEVKSGQRTSWSAGACIAGYPKKVERIEEHEGVFFECYDMVLESGNHIGVVGSHLFLTNSGQWVPVQNLRSGSKVMSLEGPVTVSSLMKRATPFVGKVYNLKIEDGEEYLVGNDGIIVRDH